MASIKAMPGVQTIYALTATTATHSINFTNAANYKGIILIVESTAETDTAVVTPAIEVPDGNGGWEAIWTAAVAISSVATTDYLIYPGATDGNFTEVDGSIMPRVGRFTFTHADADRLTYTVTCQWLK